MNKTVVTYETFHGSAKKIANIIANKLECKCINIDTPFEIEDLKEVNNLILVFNFRGPYTAQLTKLYLNRVKEQLVNKNVILVGEGLFSEKEFPVVANEINQSNPSKTFKTFFVKGQLRVDSLFPEEKILLNKFSELTGMEIKDMGELDVDRANEVAHEINNFVNNREIIESKSDNIVTEEQNSKTKWICPLCGYVHYGDNPPEVCPLCGVSGDTFMKEEA